MKGVESEIYEEAKKLIKLLGRKDGGFIAHQYPLPTHIGLTSETFETAYKAFLKWSTYHTDKYWESEEGNLGRSFERMPRN